MKKSLQDQLIKAGLGNKQQARQINTAKKKGKGQAQQEGPSEAQKKRAAQAEKDRQRNLDLQAAAQAKAAMAQTRQLIESNTIAQYHRGLPYYFLEGKKIRRLKVDERTRIQLTFGQAGIVATPNIHMHQPPIDGEQTHHYHIVPDTTLDKLVSRKAQSSIVWQQKPSSLKEYLAAHNMDDWDYPPDAFD